MSTVFLILHYTLRTPPTAWVFSEEWRALDFARELIQEEAVDRSSIQEEGPRRSNDQSAPIEVGQWIYRARYSDGFDTTFLTVSETRTNPSHP